MQDVLERAEVSRATFYTHYRDKNDLLPSDAEEFFESMATALSRLSDTSERLAAVHELFTHVAEMRWLYNALLESGRIRDVMELGQEHFARGIERRLGEIPRGGAIACGLAGSLFSLLTWWLHRAIKPSPMEMDAIFHQMVWAGAAGAG